MEIVVVSCKKKSRESKTNWNESRQKTQYYKVSSRLNARLSTPLGYEDELLIYFGISTQEGERSKSLENEMRAFRDELRKKEQYIHTLQENVELQEQTLSEFKRRVAEKNEEIKLLEEDRLALTKRIENLTRGMNYKEDKNEVTFRGLEKEKTMLMDERLQLQSQVREMSFRNEKYEEKIAELEREIFQLKQDRERFRFSGEELRDAKKDV